jgi:hypothetical protein
LYLNLQGSQRSGQGRNWFQLSKNFSLHQPYHELTTVPSAVNGEQTFRITHPFHPLCGREYILITHRLNWGEDRVSFKDENGDYHCIPAQWTDINPPDPFEQCGNNDSYFRIADLIEIMEIIRKLKK